MDQQLSIGDFARATGLTPKALRLYDGLGLVRPVASAVVRAGEPDNHTVVVVDLDQAR